MPTKLYHYTSQVGLIGILSTRTLWASKIQHLNDRQELKLGLEILKDTLQSLNNRDDSYSIICEWLCEKIEDLSGVNVFVACFSTERKQLSQWRAYSKGEVGYSLGFDVGRLQLHAKANGFMLAPCIYDPKEQQARVREAVGRRLDDFHDIRHEGDEFIRARDELCHGLQQEILDLAPLLKHHDFHEEKEWRLVSSFDALHRVKMNVRSGLHSLIPFCEFPIVDELGLMCDEITIGPCSDVTRCLDGVGTLLSTREIKNVAVRPSYTPLRVV